MQHALYVVAAASAISAPDTEVTTRYNTDNIGLHEPLLMIADESWAGVFLFTLDETNYYYLYSKSRIKKPKLETMLLIAHSGATAVNTGKIVFTQNPMAVNYPQWLAWAKYAFSELKWELVNRPEIQNKYVMSLIDEERKDILQQVNEYFDDYISLKR